VGTRRRRAPRGLTVPDLPLDGWGDARSLSDLGELMARFLEGALAEAPTCVGRPDPETDPIVAVLAQVNRAGFVTTCSQPVDTGLRQTAFVVGLCSEATARSVCAHLTHTHLTVAAVSPTQGWRHGLLVAGDRVLGLDGPVDDAALLLDEAPMARDDLAGAWQLIVADSDPAGGDRLWDLLTAAPAEADPTASGASEP